MIIGNVIVVLVFLSSSTQVMRGYSRVVLIFGHGGSTKVHGGKHFSCGWSESQMLGEIHIVVELLTVSSPSPSRKGCPAGIVKGEGKEVPRGMTVSFGSGTPDGTEFPSLSMKG